MTPASFGDFQFDTSPDALLGCQHAGAMPPCYGPLQLRNAYDIPASADGADQTIVIIDGFSSPSIRFDLGAFDHTFGLPAANLQVVAPDGATPFNIGDPVQRGWAIEEAIDVEWAHAIAPGANLVLVEARTGGDADILSATKYAIDNNLGDIISMSFSEAESCPSPAFLADEHNAFLQATGQGMTLLAASGDHGPLQPTCDGSPVAAVATPASDPLVTAVGGSRLVADPVTGTYESETAWANSGGGFSSVYRRPGYQAPFQKDNSARGLPDVAWSADAFGFGPAIALGGHGGAVGTSAATAEWAAVAAIADQAAGHRLGALNVHLYHAGKSNDAASRFHDIGGDGWDSATGLGTPDVANLVAWIAQTA